MNNPPPVVRAGGEAKIDGVARPTTLLDEEVPGTGNVCTLDGENIDAESSKKENPRAVGVAFLKVEAGRLSDGDVSDTNGDHSQFEALLSEDAVYGDSKESSRS